MPIDYRTTREKILECIISYKRENAGLAPSYQDIADRVFVSKSSVPYHLWKLEAQGLIKANGRRNITVLSERYLSPTESAALDAMHEQAEQQAGRIAELERDVDQLQDSMDREIRYWKTRAKNTANLLEQTRTHLNAVRSERDTLKLQIAVSALTTAYPIARRAWQFDPSLIILGNGPQRPTISA